MWCIEPSIKLQEEGFMNSPIWNWCPTFFVLKGTLNQKIKKKSFIQLPSVECLPLGKIGHYRILLYFYTARYFVIFSCFYGFPDNIVVKRYLLWDSLPANRVWMFFYIVPACSRSRFQTELLFQVIDRNVPLRFERTKASIPNYSLGIYSYNMITFLSPAITIKLALYWIQFLTSDEYFFRLKCSKT